MLIFESLMWEMGSKTAKVNRKSCHLVLDGDGAGEEALVVLDPLLGRRVAHRWRHLQEISKLKQASVPNPNSNTLSLGDSLVQNIQLHTLMLVNTNETLEELKIISV